MTKLGKASVIGIAMLAGTAGSAGAAELTVGLPSAHNFYAMPFYVAEEKGFFGDVTIKYNIYKGGPEVLKQVANGSADIGFAQPTDIMITNLANTGEAMPVEYWYMLETRSANQIAVPKDSAIKTIEEISGKAVGVSSPTASNVVQFRHVLELHHINPDSDVVWRSVGLGAGHVQALKDGTVQVSATNNMRHASFEQSGVALRVIPVPELDGQFGNALFSRKDMIEGKGKASFIAVAKGIAQATKFCNDNPEECVKIVFKRYPEVMSNEMSDEENRQFGLGQVAARNITMAPRDEQKGHYGQFPDSVWQSSVDFLAKTKAISGPVDVKGLYTNEIVEAAGL